MPSFIVTWNTITPSLLEILVPVMEQKPVSAAAPEDRPLSTRWCGRLLTALPLLVSLMWLGGRFSRTYGPTFYFLNYQHGFLKRALLGELLTPMQFISMRQILIMQMVIFAVLIATVYIVFWRMLFGNLAERSLAVFLLAGPALLPHFAYLSGDLDSVLCILTVLAVGSFLALPAGVALAVSLVLSLVAMLVHEGFVLLFYPALLAIMIDMVRRHRLRAGLVAAQLAVVGVAFLAILHYGKWAVPHPEYMAAAQLRTDMPLEGTVFVVMSSSLQQQLRFVATMYTPHLIFGLLLSCLTSVPYFAMLAWLLERALAVRGYTRTHRWALLLLLAAPMLLFPLGHDAMRWLSGICVNVSLFLLYLYRTATDDSSEFVTERRTLTGWTATPVYGAMLGYALALGAFSVASNRLVSNVGQLMAGKHDDVQRLKLEAAHDGFSSTGLQRALMPPAKRYRVTGPLCRLGLRVVRAQDLSAACHCVVPARGCSGAALFGIRIRTRADKISLAHERGDLCLAAIILFCKGSVRCARRGVGEEYAATQSGVAFEV